MIESQLAGSMTPEEVGLSNSQDLTCAMSEYNFLNYNSEVRGKVDSYGIFLTYALGYVSELNFYSQSHSYCVKELGYHTTYENDRIHPAIDLIFQSIYGNYDGGLSLYQKDVEFYKNHALENNSHPILIFMSQPSWFNGQSKNDSN